MANILRTYYSQKVTLVLHPSESEHELIAGMAVGWALPGFMCIKRNWARGQTGPTHASRGDVE